MSYRKKYAEYYSISLPARWEVHHIDKNRENNNIVNLIALPDFVHQQYHGIRNSASRGANSFEEAVFCDGYPVNDSSIIEYCGVLRCINKCTSLERNIHTFNQAGLNTDILFDECWNDCLTILNNYGYDYE